VAAAAVDEAANPPLETVALPAMVEQKEMAEHN